MITSISLFETPEDLEQLKQRVVNGEKIYTVINEKTVELLLENQARIINKNDISNFINILSMSGDEALKLLEGRIEKIEKVLSKSIL